MMPLARHDDLVTQEIGDELILYDRRTDDAHALNRTSALLWRHCDGHHSLADLAAMLTAEAGAPVGEEVVLAGLDDLAATGLLVEGMPAAAGRRISRKHLLLLGAGIGLLLPAIESIAVPDRAAALSI